MSGQYYIEKSGPGTWSVKLTRCGCNSEIVSQYGRRRDALRAIDRLYARSVPQYAEGAELAADRIALALALRGSR